MIFVEKSRKILEIFGGECERRKRTRPRLPHFCRTTAPLKRIVASGNELPTERD